MCAEYRSRRKIAHTELWAWADEVAIRKRFIAVGVMGEEEKVHQKLETSLDDFAITMEQEKATDCI